MKHQNRTRIWSNGLPHPPLIPAPAATAAPTPPPTPHATVIATAPAVTLSATAAATHSRGGKEDQKRA